MSGKAGMHTTKDTEAPASYHAEFLDSLDGRYLVARTLKQRLRQLTNDLGGVSALSYMEQSICKRIVHLERQIEHKELSLAHGGSVDESQYHNSIYCLRALFLALGLKRRVRVLSLKDYLAARPPTSEPATPAKDATS